jgi:hypothetical protein
MSTPPSISDILTSILNAITTAIGAIATAISDNASVIGTILIVGGLITMTMAFGRKAFSGLGGLLKGVF